MKIGERAWTVVVVDQLEILKLRHCRRPSGFALFSTLPL